MHIVEKIRNVGVHEESDLVEALQWPEAEKEEFFQVKAGLTLFQYTLLKVAFERGLK